MYRSLLAPDLKIMLQEEDALGLQEFCNVLHPAVVAEVLGEEIDTEDVWVILSNCEVPRQVEIFNFFSLPDQVRLVQSIDRKHLSQVIEAMPPDDRADLLARLDPDDVENLLPLVAQAERSDIRKLLSYPDGSAGSIMTTEYASLPEDLTVRQALDRLRVQAPNRETIYYIYILNESRRLNGIVSLRDLILAKPDAALSSIISRNVFRVKVDDDQEVVAQTLARYDLIAIPVVDEEDRLVGIVTHDDILDIVQEEATEDAYLASAVHPLEDSYLETSFFTITWKRGVWLLFLAVVALVTAKVMEEYKAAQETHIWMMWFLPLVLASGGNSGSQSATLVIRAIAVGELEQSANLRLVLRELAIGAALALGIAGLGHLAAQLFFDLTFNQAVVVFLTVFAMVMIGTLSGALFPLMFKGMGMDPALMSNPLIAALVDILGVVIYFSIAAYLLAKTVVATNAVLLIKQSADLFTV